MSIPDVDIPIKPVFFPVEAWVKAERNAERVHERMEKASAALNAAGVPFVVVGGNAVGVWVASHDEGGMRNTKDVDILLARQDLDRAADAMTAAAFDLGEADGVTFFLDRADPVLSRGVHVLFTEERVKGRGPAVAPPVKVGIVSKTGVPAIDLCELLVLKLNAWRDIDRVHIRDLIKVGLINDEIAQQIPSELRPRLEEIRAHPDG